MATPVTPAWQLWRDRRGRISALRVATLLLLLLPLAKAVAESSQIAHGARPLNELIHRAGFWALVFLGVTLAVTPFRRIFRYGNLIDVRRMLGVGTFCYIAAHLALFFADQSYPFRIILWRWTLMNGDAGIYRHRLVFFGKALFGGVGYGKG